MGTRTGRHFFLAADEIKSRKNAGEKRVRECARALAEALEAVGAFTERRRADMVVVMAAIFLCTVLVYDAA